MNYENVGVDAGRKRGPGLEFGSPTCAPQSTPGVCQNIGLVSASVWVCKLGINM